MTAAPRLLWLTKGAAVNPASRYRYLQFLPWFERAGFQVTVRPLFGEDYYRALEQANLWTRSLGRAEAALKGGAGRLAALALARSVDLVTVENQLFPYEPGGLEEILFRINPKSVIEFDDAIYLTPHHEGKLRRTLARAHHVIVGNGELCAFARQATSKVSVVPTVVDLSRYPASERPRPSQPRAFRIGWIGLPVNLPNLTLIQEPLKALAEQGPVELWVVSSRPIHLPGLPTRFIPWEEATETRVLSEIDVGVMPLKDDPWSRGKCGLKLLQYMAAGKGVVASPVGVNAHILTHGEDGFLARTETEWLAALQRLQGDPQLCHEMGRQARSTVERRFSLEVWGPRLVDLYRELL